MTALLTVGLQILLKLAIAAFNYFGVSEEKKKWLADVSDTLRKKGWIRSKFILELESKKIKAIDDKLSDRENDKTEQTK